MSQRPLRPADLMTGDQVDFEPILLDLIDAATAARDFEAVARYNSNLVLAERQNFELVARERGEMPNTWVLHTDHISVELPSDTQVLVERNRR